MRRWALIAVLVIAGATQAQTATPSPVPTGAASTPAPTNAAPCGYGLPCGPLAWALPAFPALTSPTPNPVVNEAGLTIPHNPYGTLDPAMLASPGESLASMLATAGALASTPSVGGTPISLDSEIANLQANATDFLSLAKGISQMSFGPFSPLVALLFSTFTLIFIFKITTFALPLLGVIVGIVRKGLSLLLDFLPF